MKAWQCIGCGRLEGAQPCVGVCQDRAVQVVYAGEWERSYREMQRRAREVLGIALRT